MLFKIHLRARINIILTNFHQFNLTFMFDHIFYGLNQIILHELS